MLNFPNPNGNFLGDDFEIPDSLVNPVTLLGDNYTLPADAWKAEELLPRRYYVSKFALRKLWQTEHWVSWAEADMLLNMEPGIIPVGWRAVTYLYNNQEMIPQVWLEHLSDGNPILFPYAYCYYRNWKGTRTICPAFVSDYDKGRITCQAVLRNVTGASMAIGVYQI